MRDSYGRVIDYIRISITDRCNLRCVYCMPEEGVQCVSHNDILTYDEILRLCNIFADLGIRRVKITGGEPLVRKNIQALISGIYNIEGMEEVTLTTNGILLKEQAEALINAGIRAVNISLDTLDAEHYHEITRGGDVEKVKASLIKMLEYPEVTVKINCVPDNISDEEIIQMAHLAMEWNVHVRFIELMPIGMGKDLVEHCDQETRIKKLLTETYGPLHPYNSNIGNGPSHYYDIEGFQGKIGFISAISHKFCNQCNRVRLTAQGYLKTCLQYDVGSELLPLLRSEASKEEIQSIIRATIEEKPKEHQFLKNADHCELKTMSQIGG